MTRPRLGVNIDHVATLRNARGGTHPDPLTVAQAAIAAGADGITLHLREDRRHIRDDDLARIRKEILAPVNLEMAATDEMVEIACRTAPHACCIVPERRQEVTTEGGLDAAGQFDTLRPIVHRLNGAGIRVSLFIDPDRMQLEAAQALGAPVVELHTGAYAEGNAGELDRLRDAAALTRRLRLECHAGHGLTYDNAGAIAVFPDVRELNIGHFLIGEALLVGLPRAIERMLAVMSPRKPGGEVPPPRPPALN
jgi:pyridoxine 5-phosphate synthase